MRGGSSGTRRRRCRRRRVFQLQLPEFDARLDAAALRGLLEELPCAHGVAASTVRKTFSCGVQQPQVEQRITRLPRLGRERVPVPEETKSEASEQGKGRETLLRIRPSVTQSTL